MQQSNNGDEEQDILQWGIERVLSFLLVQINQCHILFSFSQLKMMNMTGFRVSFFTNKV